MKLVIIIALIVYIALMILSLTIVYGGTIEEILAQTPSDKLTAGHIIFFRIAVPAITPYMIWASFIIPSLLNVPYIDFDTHRFYCRCLKKAYRQSGIPLENITPKPRFKGLVFFMPRKYLAFPFNIRGFLPLGYLLLKSKDDIIPLLEAIEARQIACGLPSFYDTQ